jgi:hypothetical protein
VLPAIYSTTLSDTLVDIETPDDIDTEILASEGIGGGVFL